MDALAVLLTLVLVTSPCYSTTSTEESPQENVHYIMPTVTPRGANVTCPISQGCYSFEQVVSNETISDNVLQSNTKLMFLTGDHILSDLLAGVFFLVRDLVNLTFEGVGGLVAGPYLLEPQTRIICTSQFGLAFANITNLTFHNLTFTNCGTNLTEDLISLAFDEQTFGFHETGTNQKVAFFFINIHDFTINTCSIQNSTGYGLLGVNVLGTSVISRTGFLTNNVYTTMTEYCQLNIPNTAYEVMSCNGGNAFFIFEDLPECPLYKEIHALIIADSVFAYGASPYGGQLPESYISRGTGIGVTLGQSSYGVNVVFQRVTSLGNSALVGANIYLAMYDSVDNSTIVVRGSSSRHGNNILLRTDNFLGISNGLSGGLHFDYGLSSPPRICSTERKYKEDVLRISNSVFHNNSALSGAGVYLNIRHGQNFYRDDSDYFVARIRIEDSFMNSNQGMAGAGLFVMEFAAFGVLSRTDVIIRNVEFISNGFVLPIKTLTRSAAEYRFSTMELVSARNVTVVDCNFSSNEASGLTAFDSNVLLVGDIVFEKNIGTSGGAMDLKNSFLFITPNAHINFTENFALHHGGAINVVMPEYLFLPCFFQVEDPGFLPEPNIRLFFEDNFASEAGSVLYGGAIDTCNVGPRSTYSNRSSTYVFDQITDIGVHSNKSSLISSDPVNVCPCINGIPNCSILPNRRVYPGETFLYPVIALGQRNGTAPSLVYATLNERDSNFSLDDLEQVQQVNKICTNLSFTVRRGADNNPTLSIRGGSGSPSSSFILALQILDCPLGFVLRDGVCRCDPVSQINDYNLTCDIGKQTVRRAGGSWVNASFSGPEGDYNGVIVHVSCPYDYCLSEDSDVNLDNPDTQCTNNRTGILCGACQPGLSKTLATSQCKKCSNNSIALLLAYALAGILLVCVLFALNLTISMGTLGGIIFYANIVYINLAIFFPQGSLNVLVIFISWLNLYPGADFCFYDGMDQYVQTWLEYAFPLYIWFIITLIVLASRCSLVIAKLCGARVIPVLATLFLLSYTKLIQAVIYSLSSTELLFPDGSRRIVWTVDGNVRFYSGKHIPLAIMAIVVLLLFLVPYTLLLVLVPLPKVQALSNYRFFSWINRLKPFLDAHYGPYKDRYRNWTGVLLLVRSVLAILFSLNLSNNPAINPLINTIAMFLLLSVAWGGGGVYKQWPHNILQCSFFLNVGILSGSTLLVQATGGNQAVVFYVSGSIALVTFIGIILYHLIVQLQKLRRFKSLINSCFEKFTIVRWLLRKNKQDSSDDVEEEAVDNTSPYKGPSVTYVGMDSELREPLIED